MEEIKKLVSKEQIEIFNTICSYIDTHYEMEKIGHKITNKWDYEYKFRKSNKTLCAFYFKQGCMGFMVILGEKERNKFEENRNEFSSALNHLYDITTTYHDGKWLMLEIEDLSFFDDIKKLLSIKRKTKKAS